jgi:SAM-dependent methyltransferase
VIELDRAGRVPGAVRYNCVLDDAQRERYAATIRRMKELVPEMMAKKIERANVQQAFVKETVERFAKEYTRPTLLCVGSFEDTACESLKKLGREIDAIDPVVNYDLETFSRLDTTVRGGYDVIFSTSVIEHVPDDEGFLQTILELLAPGGVAVLTMDYKDGWRPGDPKPAVDRRLYTREDLLGRFIPCWRAAISSMRTTGSMRGRTSRSRVWCIRSRRWSSGSRASGTPCRPCSSARSAPSSPGGPRSRHTRGATRCHRRSRGCGPSWRRSGRLRSNGTS